MKSIFWPLSALVCLSPVRLSASPCLLRLSAWLDVLCLSPLAGVQRTAGTSYKAWCRTSPLNPPRPPLYRDRLAPGKVRFAHQIPKTIDCPFPSILRQSPTRMIVAQTMNLNFRCRHVSVLSNFKACVGVNSQSCSYTDECFLWYTVWEWGNRTNGLLPGRSKIYCYILQLSQPVFIGPWCFVKMQ